MSSIEHGIFNFGEGFKIQPIRSEKVLLSRFSLVKTWDSFSKILHSITIRFPFLRFNHDFNCSSPVVSLIKRGSVLQRNFLSISKYSSSNGHL